MPRNTQSVSGEIPITISATLRAPLPRQPGGALGRGEDPARFPKEPSPRRRELDVALDAAQQVDLELGLEIADLLAQGRLGRVQAFRRAAEMELLRDRDEIAKMSQLHVSVPFHRSDG